MTTFKTSDLPRVGFVSLGCPKATVDSEHILTRLRAEGYSISGSYDDADLVIVTGNIERVSQFEQGLWAERVALLRAVNRDLRDSRIVTSRDLVANVAIVPARFPDSSGLNG